MFHILKNKANKAKTLVHLAIQYKIVNTPHKQNHYQIQNSHLHVINIRISRKNILNTIISITTTVLT